MGPEPTALLAGIAEAPHGSDGVPPVTGAAGAALGFTCGGDACGIKPAGAADCPVANRNAFDAAALDWITKSGLVGCPRVHL